MIATKRCLTNTKSKQAMDNMQYANHVWVSKIKSTTQFYLV